MNPDFDFNEVRECDYKGEHFSVRDNGAIMRHPKDGRTRPADNEWSFGIMKRDGYMYFCRERVNNIVASAFLGWKDLMTFSVHHIDRDTRNNRPENLRWFTKLEYNFLKNHTIEELENSEYLASKVRKHQSKMQIKSALAIDAVEFQRQKAEELMALEEERNKPRTTSNPLAFQFGWSGYPQFPLCPESVENDPIGEYMSRLQVGLDFVSSKYGKSEIYKFTRHEDKIIVMTKIIGSFKPWGLCFITWENGSFVHNAVCTYFEEDGALSDYTKAQGIEWDGPDSIDHYCD